MGHFKVFIEFLTILLLVYVFFVCFPGCEACGILALWPGIEPTPLELEGEILTIEPTEKSHKLFFSYPIYSLYDQQAKVLICTTVLLLNLYHFPVAFESKLNLTWIWKSFTMCISLAYQQVQMSPHTLVPQTHPWLKDSSLIMAQPWMC